MLMPTTEKHVRALSLFLAGVVFLLDQGTKWWVAGTLALGETRTVISGLFNLTHVHNRGAAFGLFAHFESVWAAALLIVFSAAAMVLVLVLLWRNHAPRLAGWGLALILGGAAGNLLDRLRAGRVVDFLDFHLGPYHWPAFNVADAAIVVGAATLIYQVLQRRHEAPSEG